jgi:ABC-type multidrug transport system fused ATPase/permease subunit
LTDLAVSFSDALITLLSASVFVILTVVSYVGAYWASKTLHERMLGSVTRSTLRWFDTTPSGRIVNRFSRDQATVDDQLSHSIRSVVWWASSLLVSIVVM